MVGIELEEHPLPLRMGHRVTLEARRRGAIIRPLGDVVVLMPPLAISEAELRRLVSITAEAIDAATGGGGRCADGRLTVTLVGLEVLLARPADGAEPVVGNFLEGRAGRDSAVGVAVCGVVDEPARGADEELGLAHRRERLVDRRRPQVG